jgi:hypothetical protein
MTSRDTVSIIRVDPLRSNRSVTGASSKSIPFPRKKDKSKGKDRIRMAVDWILDRFRTAANVQFLLLGHIAFLQRIMSGVLPITFACR